MGLEECARSLSKYSVYVLGYSYGFRVVYAALDKGLSLSNVEDFEQSCRGVDLIAAPAGSISADALSAEAGEVLSVMLLVKPVVALGDVEEYRRIATAYAERVLVEEAWRLKKLLGEAYHRLRVTPHMPLILRLARITNLYPWLRPLVNAAIASSLEVHEWLKALGREAASRTELFTEARNPPRFLQPLKEPETPTPRRPKPASLVEALQIAVDASRVLEGLRTRPHPLLKDPFLLARLDSARLATKLMNFQEQLFTITGVNPLLAKIKRSSLIRSAARIEAEGFTPAIVKWYRGPLAFKWLLVYVASLHLPKPRISPRKRLLAEYEYNRRLWEKGYLVPKPILVDPRRLLAAYEYIEGVNLMDLIRQAYIPPQLKDVGHLLASLHRDGFALWDTNPTNFVVTSRGVYLVDLEQARETNSVEDKAWDLALLAYYPASIVPREAASRAAMIAKAYIDAGGNIDVVLEASKPRYMIPFLAVVAPNILEKTRRALQYVSKGYS